MRIAIKVLLSLFYFYYREIQQALIWKQKCAALVLKEFFSNVFLKCNTTIKLSLCEVWYYTIFPLYLSLLCLNVVFTFQIHHRHDVHKNSTTISIFFYFLWNFFFLFHTLYFMMFHTIYEKTWNNFKNLDVFLTMKIFWRSFCH